MHSSSLDYPEQHAYGSQVDPMIIVCPLKNKNPGSGI